MLCVNSKDINFHRLASSEEFGSTYYIIPFISKVLDGIFVFIGYVRSLFLAGHRQFKKIGVGFRVSIIEGHSKRLRQRETADLAPEQKKNVLLICYRGHSPVILN